MHENAVWAPTKKQVKKIKKGRPRRRSRKKGLCEEVAQRRSDAQEKGQLKERGAEVLGDRKEWKKEKRQTGREWKSLKLQRGGLVLLDLRWKASRLEKPKAEGLGEITSSKARL